MYLPHLLFYAMRVTENNAALSDVPPLSPILLSQRSRVRNTGTEDNAALSDAVPSSPMSLPQSDEAIAVKTSSFRRAPPLLKNVNLKV